jgi:cell division control protein 11
MSVHCISSAIKYGFLGGSAVAFLELEKDGVHIALTIVDTPGFGDNIDNKFACVCLFDTRYTCSSAIIRFQEIVGYLEHQYDDILAEELHIKCNPRFRDNRVHALLYFIPHDYPLTPGFLSPS